MFIYTPPSFSSPSSTSRSVHFMSVLTCFKYTQHPPSPCHLFSWSACKMNYTRVTVHALSPIIFGYDDKCSDTHNWIYPDNLKMCMITHVTFRPSTCHSCFLPSPGPKIMCWYFAGMGRFWGFGFGSRGRKQRVLLAFFVKTDIY